MKGLSSTPSHRNRRSSPTCSFCRSPEHRVSDCPHVKPIWESLQQGIIPLAYMRTVEENDTSGLTSTWRQNSSYWRSPLSTYYTNGNAWGDLYKIAESSYNKWERAQNKTKPNGKRTRVQTCGYCKETGHTRTKCEHLTFHKDLLIRANRNFRKWFYEEYVVKQGLSTGAIVSFEFVSAERWNSASTRTKIQTLVTDINWDSINLLSVLDLDAVQINYRTNIDGAGRDKMYNIRDFLRSKVVLKIPATSLAKCEVNTNYYENNLGYYGISLPMYVPQTQSNRITDYYQLLNYDNQDKVGYSGNKVENVSIVQPAPQALSDDWIDGFSTEMSVIFSKFSQKQLEFFGVIEHIKDWATKEV